MDVTNEERALLTRELDRVLGNEAATIMMAHLPDGGRDSLATKQDLIDLRVDVMKGLERFATKDDLRRFATKDDLRRFATKDDLRRFATKDDLSRFATKDDLDRCATKDDLSRFATKDDLDRCATKEALEATNDRLSVTNEQLGRLSDRVDRGFSEVATQIGHMVERMTSLETRVDGILVAVRSEIRGVLLDGVASQTRTLVISLFGTVAIICGLAFAVAASFQP